ncbi:5'-nucleotidase /3'-nucleotidase /exopolyphosphatase [Pseudarcicella hirudinis]|uniref:5'-nucleotidase SurE n=1 Tax=Pseudarcicella hirudinis TaxID=1079859 RepID=A0A1I5N3B8_9BACT|nr:5'/3'-nucleotidase SurE [Pseudarcicella hirudinis]SFP15781.1 5'-nucleotidase /3'-nucleotidase /exopolyphosphatase [Pseudarcicella hirudinis]
MSTDKPLILISNDDSIASKGIKVLTEVMSEIGDVVVVAPDSHQSGMGHAITLGTPLRVSKSLRLGPEIEAYKCSGTPADCIKFGKHFILKERKIDLVVSGINHGSNSSISVIYSGTMSAAIEAALEGIPAIGFSLCDFSADADFDHIRAYVKNIAQKVIEEGLPTGLALNVNFPAKTDQPIAGVKIARQAIAVFRETFEERRDPYGKPYYWMDGFLQNNDNNGGTDEDALKENFISIVPVKFDLTDYQAIEQLKSWNL